MPPTPEFWSNSFNVANNFSEDATDPQIIQLSNGNTLIAWTSADDSSPTDQNGLDIRGQIFDPFGAEVGTEFRLNMSRSAHEEFLPSLTAIDGGGFAVAYLDLDLISGIPPTFNTSPVVDVFSDTGVHIRGEVLENGVNNSDGFTANAPVIASTSATSTFTAWIDVVAGDVQGRFYNPSSDATGAITTIFSGSTGAGEGVNSLAVTALNNGNYAVVWGNDNPGDDFVQFRVINGATGANLGSTITVATFADVDDVAITTLESGRLLIAYEVDGTGGTNSGVRHQVLNADGSAFGPVGTTPTTTAGNQFATSVVALADGGGVVFWFDENTFDLHGQRVSATGAKVGSEFDVRAFNSTDISNISAVGLEDGRLQIVWQEKFTPDDVRTVIMDTRDNANSPDSNGYQIGTIGNDAFDVEAGAREVYGFGGNDRISVDAGEVGNADVFDGGSGTDVLVLEDDAAGIWGFAGEAVRNFEEIEFFATNADVTRTAEFLASQLVGVNRFDFDGGPGSEEILQILMGGTSNLDLSGVTVEGFESADDLIRIIGNSSAESITGTTENDSISGSTGSDTLNGGDGDDRLVVHQDGVANFYNGGSGLDTLDFSVYGAAVSLSLLSLQASGAVVTGGTTSNFTGITNVIGSATGDTLQGFGTVSGNGGNDNLRGRGDNDVNGGDGDDTLRLDDFDGTPNFDGGNETDTFDTASLASIAMYVELDAGYRKGTVTAGTFHGTLANIENYNGDSDTDFVIGTSANNVISTNSGNDTIDGGGGNDTMNGGFGNDLFLHSLGSDTFNGDANTDTVDYSGAAGSVVVDLSNAANNALAATGDVLNSIEVVIGSSSSDDLTGDALNNTFTGGGGNDVYNGGAGDDTMIGGAGDETFNGGADNDLIDYSFVGGDSLIFNLGANFFAGSAEAGNDTINGIENLLLGEGNDRVFGTSTANFLRGNDGEDTLAGLDGNDSILGEGDRDAIQGGNGNDTLRGGDENDRIFGGSDNDFLYGDAGDDLMNGGNGDDYVTGGADDDNAVVGGNDNDTVLGEGGNDGLSGGNGDDSVFGGTGDDRVFGGQGEDTLWGDLNNDTMGGGSENDLMFGGSGNDAMNGNTGNDTMDGGTGMDTMFGSNGNDVINGGDDDGASDLLVGQGGLDTYVFVGNWGTDQIARYGELVQGGPRTFNEVIDMSGTTANSFAELQIAQIGNSTFVNINGDAVNSIEILFQNAAGITSADFIF